MGLWLFAAVILVATFAALEGIGALVVRRYCASHVVAQLAVAGHGLHLSCTVEGGCWRLRLRSCRRRDERAGLSDPPPATAVREPRRPLGPGPVAGALEQEPPLQSELS